MNIEFAILQQNMAILPRKEKQTYRLNTWPQILPSGWIYQIKYWIRYILWQNDLIVMKRKIKVSIEHCVSDVAISFDLGQYL